MRAVAEAYAEGDDPDELRRLEGDEELEDEVEPQHLEDLNLGMEVRA